MTQSLDLVATVNPVQRSRSLNSSQASFNSTTVRNASSKRKRHFEHAQELLASRSAKKNEKCEYCESSNHFTADCYCLVVEKRSVHWRSRKNLWCLNSEKKSDSHLAINENSNFSISSTTVSNSELDFFSFQSNSQEFSSMTVISKFRNLEDLLEAAYLTEDIQSIDWIVNSGSTRSIANNRADFLDYIEYSGYRYDSFSEGEGRSIGRERVSIRLFNFTDFESLIVKAFHCSNSSASLLSTELIKKKNNLWHCSKNNTFRRLNFDEICEYVKTTTSVSIVQQARNSPPVNSTACKMKWETIHWRFAHASYRTVARALKKSQENI